MVCFEAKFLGFLSLLTQALLPKRLHITHQGGRVPGLNTVAKEIWELCLLKHVQLQAEHIPGVNNGLCHRLSWLAAQKMEWCLNPVVFRKIDCLWGPHETDLFAAQENAQLKSYFSLYPDMMALGTDAFLFKWTSLKVRLSSVWSNRASFSKSKKGRQQ